MKTKKITEIIKSFFSKNISLKIFSIVLAFAMWFIVMSSLNPSETKPFNVPLTINGTETLKENGLVCLNMDALKSQVIKVRIKATRPNLNTLSGGRDKVIAAIDLGRFSSYYYQDLSEPFTVNVIPNLSEYSSAYQIVGYAPSTLSVSMDRLIDFDVPVRVMVEGETDDSYVHREPVPAVTSIRVNGPESLAETVAYAGLSIDLSKVTDDYTADVKPELYKADGSVIDSELFTVSVNTVQVSTTVLRQGDISIEVPMYTGRPETGYAVTDISCSPETIKVMGDESANRDPLVLPEINISEANASITKTFDIEDLLTERGLTAASDENLTVTVEIKIEKIDETDITIPGKNIVVSGLEDGLELEEPINDITVGVYDTNSEINASAIYGSVDLSGLSEGSHNVEVTVSFPEGIEPVGKIYTEVNIKKAFAQETISAPETEEATTEETTEAETDSENLGG